MSRTLEAPAKVTTAPPRGRHIRMGVLATISLVVIVVIIVAVSLSHVIAPDSPTKQNLTESLAAPSAAHWFGTDSLGRDVLSRLLYGGGPSLIGVLIAVATFLIVGVCLGLVGGYSAGRAGQFIAAVADGLLALPAIVLILAVLAIFSQSLIAAMIVFGILSSGNLIRVVRAVVLTTREELYIAAAVTSGLTTPRILARHVLPGLVGPVVVQASLFAGIALAVQTGLGFLGVTNPPPAASWGGMVGDAAQTLSTDPSYLFFSGGIIFVMTLALALLGDGVRDANARRFRSAYVGKATRRRAAPALPSDEVAAPPSDALLSLRGYSVAFDTEAGSKEILHAIDLDVARGEIVGLVGESGSGKTVTGLSLLGLLPANARVTSGSATMQGDLISGSDENALRKLRGRRIGLVSQEPMASLDPLFTIGAQVGEVVRRLSGGNRSAVRRKSLELLASVRLPDPVGTFRKHPHELSGGMLQRVSIALALAGDPDLLIADEPTTALDVTVQAEVLDLLLDLRRDRGMAILFITHDLGVVADICDRAVVMSAGSVVENAAVDDLFYGPHDDYTRKLIESTPSILEVTP